MATLQEALASLPDPTIRHIVSLSGGKDSAALAIFLRNEFPEIPAEYVFCDTGAELKETYAYLERLEQILGKPIARLNAMDLLDVEKKPGRNAFDFYLDEIYGGYLPNPRSRWCTRVLKIRPFEEHVGTDRAFSYIAIRGDENRDGFTAKKPPVISEQPNIIPVYPFKDLKKGIDDVKMILTTSKIGFPEYYEWRSRSGCYFCFYQQIGEWQRLKDRHPELWEMAKKYEKLEGDKRFTWVQGKSLEQIASMDRKPLPVINETEGCAICHL
jgi:3'-phosphoadenosine 5'-phosphosulfate sulfotransferase (PAPS reductase)/FAD synthetase